MSSTGIVAGVAPGSATITAAVDGKSATSVVTVLDGGLVPATGTTLNLASGAVQIAVPPDALPGRTSLFVASSSAFANDPRVVKGTPFDFGPSGTSFAKPVSVRIKYDPANLPPGTEESALQIHLSASSGWQVIEGSTADIAAKVVTAEVSHFSTYAILTPAPVAAVAIRGPPEKPILENAVSLVVGETEQLTATLTDSDGHILSNRAITWASSDAGMVSVTSSGLVAAVKPGSAKISASAGGVTSSITVTVTPVPVASVAVTLTPPTITVGQTSQAAAVLKDAHGTLLDARPVAWASNNATVATVNPTTGVVTALTPGSATITGTSEGQSGTSTITVTPVPVASVSVSLAASSIAVGGTTTASATTLDASNNVLAGRSIAWSSDNTAVATVSSAGVVTAISTGAATITGTSEGKSGSATLTVTPVPVAGVSVSPPSALVTVGTTQQLAVTLTDAHGSVLSGRAVSWSSSDVAVATVSSTGLVTAIASGTVTISATSEGRIGTSSLTITPVPVSAVSVGLGATSLFGGQTTQATATTLDGSGGVLSGRVVTWSSSNTAVATVSASGLVTAVVAGTAEITATSEGKSGSATLTVTPIPVATVAVTLTPSTITAGGATQASVVVRDAKGSLLTGRAVAWSSDNAAVATVNATGLVSAIGVGSATITATVEGKSGTAVIIVTPIPVASVTATLAASSIHIGQTTQATATTLDAGGIALTGRSIAWSSDNNAIATVSSTGLVSAVSAGNATITATSEGKSGSATLTVTPVPVATVTLSSLTTPMIVGGTQTLTATTTDAGDAILTARTVSWVSSNTAVLTVSPASSTNATTTVTAVGVGTATITATSETAPAATTPSITVNPVPVATVAVTPSSATLLLGIAPSQQLTVVTKDAPGRVLTGRTVAWTSSNTAVATVDGNGLVTAVAAGGPVTITATSEGVIGTSEITVSPAPVTTVTLSSLTTPMIVGGTQVLTAVPRDGSSPLAGRTVSWVSSNPAVLAVSAAVSVSTSSGATVTVTAVGVGAATITATSETAPAVTTALITVNPVPVSSLTLSSPTTPMIVGGTQTLTATTKDVADNSLTGRTVSWVSSNTAVLTVSPTSSTSGTATVTAVSVGTATITATSETAPAATTPTITVNPVPVATVTVTPSSATLVLGVTPTQQLAAVTKDVGNNVLSGRTVSWTSNNTAVATVDGNGLVTAVAAGGPVTITATSEGKTGSSSITVTPAPVATVTLSSPTTPMVLGDTQSLTVVTRDAANNVLTGRTVNWVSSNTAVLTVSPASSTNGTTAVTAVGVGGATITATSETASAATTPSITVNPVPVVSVTLSAPTTPMTVGGTQVLTASPKDAGGTTLSGRTVSWVSSNSAVLTVSAASSVSTAGGATVTVRAVGTGTATITATSETAPAATTPSIMVNPAPVAAVTVTPSSATLVHGITPTQQLTAVTRDAADNVLSGRPVTWSSSDESVATVDVNGLVTAHVVGSATITAVSEGKTGASSITVTPAPVATVSVTLALETVAIGRTTQASAVTRDENGNVLTGRAITWSSATPGVATVDATTGAVTAVAAGTATIAATSEGISGTGTITVVQVPVATVTVALVPSTITAVETAQASATTLDESGEPLTGRAITWTSDNTAVATVSTAGVVTGVAPGTAHITATSEGRTGGATLTVTPAPVASVSVTLTASSITTAETTQATATMRDARGQTLTGRIPTWSSDNAAVASVNPATGLVTAVGVGSATITAASEGRTGSALIAVTLVPVNSVSVVIGVASLVEGETTQATATVVDANNNALTGREIAWTSDAPSIATVNNSGFVTAVSPGTATIRATSEGRSGSATIGVTAIPVATVTVIPAAASLVEGYSQQLSAETRAASSGLLTGRVVNWDADNSAIATVSPTGVVTAHSAGSATITATSEGKSGTAAITVTQAPVASVNVSLSLSSIVAGGTTQATAITLDGHGSPLTGRSILWSSDNSAVATVNPVTGLVSAVSPGSATITATSEGKSGAAVLAVSPIPVASVAASLALGTIEVGQTTQATAVTRDGSGNVLTGRAIVWSSALPGVATVSATGVVTAVAPGTAEIVATSEGRSGSATITVVPVSVASVTVALVPTTITAVETSQATATTRDASGGLLTGRPFSWSSSNNAVATVSSSGIVTAVSEGPAIITATSEGKTGVATLTVTPAPVASVSVAITESTIVAGTTTQATATLHDARAGVLTGRIVTWSSDNTNVATVSGTGIVTAVGPGTANITAASEGKIGSASVTVTPVRVASVSVSLALTTVEAGQATQATATTLDASNNPLTGRSIIWSSGAPSVATVDPATGLVTSSAPGTATITATSEGKSGSATLTVTPVPVASVGVTPSSAGLVAGETLQLAAESRDAHGSVLSGRAVSWSSSDVAVATVSSTGLVTAIASGTVTISATSEGRIGTSSLTITPVPVSAVSVGLGATSLFGGQTTQATATTLDGSGGVLSGRVVTWSSSNTAVATVSASGLVTAVVAGTAEITATSEGKSGSATLTVTPIPVATVAVTLTPSTITAVETAQASAITRDGSGSLLPGRAVAWSSDNTGVATVDPASGLVTAVSAGTATITGRSEGKSGTAVITVTAVPIASISVSLTASSIHIGQTTQATATTLDAGGNALTGRSIAWSSDNNAIATVSSTGLVSAVSAGSATITATSEGKSGSGTLAVTLVSVASVAVTLTPSTITTVETAQASAVTLDANGGTVTGRAIVWSSDNSAVATVSQDGVVTTVSAGTAHITATSEGQSGSATLTVTPPPVVTVTVSPASSSLIAGETQQLTAALRDAHSNMLTGRVVTWVSNAPGVATVSSTGVVTAVSAGDATITATSEGQSGTASVTVPPVPVASVIVSPATANVVVAGAQQLTATTIDASNNVLTGRIVTWSSDNTNVSTVSTNGLVTGVSAGSAQITATSEGKSGTASVTVTPIRVATVNVTLQPSSITAVETAQATALTLDANGGTLTGRAVVWSSNNPAVATVSQTGLVTAVSEGTAEITASSEGKTASATLTVTPAPVASVSVALTASSITAVQATQATATVRDARGAILTGRSITWSSDNTSVVTVAATGLVTAVGPGAGNIVATSEGKSGSAALTVTPAAVATVNVSLALASIEAGQSTQATAATLDVNGGTLTGRTIDWVSDNTSVATVSSGGVVSSIAPGIAAITARSEGKSGSATLTVTPVPVATVAVTPVAASIAIGFTQQLSAETRGANNNVLTGRAVTWSSSDGSVATVDVNGLVTAHGVGATTITAASEGKTGTSSVTVTPAPVATVTLSSLTTPMIVGGTQVLAATTADAGGSILTGRTVSWVSSNPAVLTVGPASSTNGTTTVTAVGVGTATITATSESKTATTPSITVIPVPVATVAVTPSSATLVLGITPTQQLTAVTRDAGDNVLSGRTVTWSSSDGAVATVDVNGLVTAHALGSATITAASEGKTGTSSITVTPAPVASVSVALVPSSVTAIETSQATATTFDANGGVLTGRAITWSSDNTSVATVSPAGLVTAVSAGTANIIGTSEGKTGSAPLTVTPAPVATVTLSSPTTPMVVGGTQSLTATTKDAANNALTGRTVSWVSSNTAVLTVSPVSSTNGTTTVTAAGAGTATITATSETAPAATTPTITVNPVPVATVSVTPSSATLVLGVTPTQQLTAVTKDAGGNVLTGRTVSWTSNNTAVATVDGSGLVTAVAAGGPVTITATSEGMIGTSAITVNPAPVATVTLSSPTTPMVVGGTQSLTAVTKDAANNVLTGRTVSWVSSNTAVLTVSPASSTNGTTTVTAVGVGTATITATSETAPAATTPTITVNPVPVATVSVTPSSATLVLGVTPTQQLTAVTKDAGGNVLTGRTVTWSTSNSAVATVDASGVVTAVAAGGPVTITATSEGKTGTSSITVTPAPVATVTLSSPTTPMVVGGTQSLTAVTKDAANNVLTGRTVSWVSSNTAVLTVSPASSTNGTTTVTAVGVGTATITATSETAPAATTPSITVNPVPVASVTAFVADDADGVGGLSQV